MPSVVDAAECEQHQPEVPKRVKGADSEQDLLQEVDEALGAAITPKRPDEGRRALDAKEANLGLEGFGYVLAALVAADGQAASNVFATGTLMQQLKCLGATTMPV